MKKIPTIFVRDPETNLRHVLNEWHPDCGWVRDGEGTATYKWDGTAVKIIDNEIWKRREIKPGKPIPPDFDQEGDEDPNSGKRVGWMPCDPEAKEDRWHFEAYATWPDPDIPDGTYELVGPKVQGNPHVFKAHQLMPHGEHVIDGAPVDFDKLAEWMHRDTLFSRFGEELSAGFEGIVWHHPDGRMAKIKVRDFPKPNAA
jgi:hypothetical protein